MLAEISQVSDINTNITNMEARTGDDQQARIDMTVEISDVKHLERVIKSIKGVQGVLGSSGRLEPNTAGRLRIRPSTKLAGGPSGSALFDYRNHIDLDARISWQRGNLHRRSGWRRIDDVAGVDCIHRSEFIHIREEDRGADDMREARACGRQQRADVAHDLLGLSRDTAIDQQARRWVEADLSGEEQQVARADARAVRTDGFRRVGRRNRQTHVRLPW
jgi:hypothetical protein